MVYLSFYLFVFEHRVYDISLLIRQYLGSRRYPKGRLSVAGGYITTIYIPHLYQCESRLWVNGNPLQVNRAPSLR